MKVKTYGIYIIFCITLSFFTFSTWLSLSRFDTIQAYGDILKYISIITVFIPVLGLKKTGKSDSILLLTLSVFIFMLSLFTFININSLEDLLILFGYYLCFFIFYFLSTAKSIIHYSLQNALFYLSIIFIYSNIAFILDPASYSPIKGQFTGYFANANAFTGLCGLFFIINFSKLSTNSKSFICILNMLILLIYLVLGSSRGAILATVIASLFIIHTSKNKKVYVYLGIILVISMFLFKDFITVNLPNRDIFEETGRESIFRTYWDELADRYFYLGTGVSVEAGRLKTELSYLDILLMSGFIGFFSFITFATRTLYLAYYLKNTDAIWLTPLYIYILVSSIFEGYVANIMSVISLLFYLVSALIYSNYKEFKKFQNNVY